MLIASVGWRSIFFINVPIGAIGLYLTRRYTAETGPGEHRIDVRGQLAAVIAMTALAAGLIEGGSAGFTSPFVIAALALAAAALAAFFTLEARSGEPMLPLPLFRRPSFAAPALLGLVANVAFYGLIFVFSLYFQRVQGDSALRAGLAFLPLTAVVLAANVLSGRIAGRIGVRGTILLGLAAMIVGCAGLLIVRAGTPFSEIVAQQVLLGGGLGLVVPPMTSTLMGSVDRSRSGIASGTLNTARQSGSVLGVAVFGSLVAAHGRFIDGFRIALVISIGLVITGMLLASRIRPPAADSQTGGRRADTQLVRDH